MTQIRTRQKISVVLPAYNEGKSLPQVIRSVFATLMDEGVDIEIVVIDDGSTDGTREAVLGIDHDRGTLRYLRFSRNFGKEAALSAGLDAASGNAVILMDSDGQHPPAVLKTFLARWRAGAEVVCGIQRGLHENAAHRRLRGLYYSLLEGGSSISIPRHAGDFRLLDRKVVNAIKALPERNRFMKGLYAWVGFKVEFIEFEVACRIAGSSKFNWRRLFGLGITGLTSFSVVPLRLVTIVGLVISAASVLYGIYLIAEHYASGSHLAGWATIAVGMMFLSGLQLLALGIIAEYLGRTFNEVKQRPAYIVAEETRVDGLNIDLDPLSQKATALDVPPSTVD